MHVPTVADDILFCGEGDTTEETIQDHDKKLIALLERCRQIVLKLNKDNFKLKLTEIPYAVVRIYIYILNQTEYFPPPKV